MTKKTPAIAKPALSQDPHKTKEQREKVLEVAIGREVRAFRRQHNITVAELAKTTGLSTGMLSKIENGMTSPSLTTLQTLANALSMPITAFFRGFEEQREAVLVKAGTGLKADRRGTRAGHQYNLLGHIGNNSSGVIVEPYLITLTEESDTFPDFQHDGMEFIYMLDGEIEYRHGDQTYLLQKGDSFFFDADAPHGPTKAQEIACPLPVNHILSARELILECLTDFESGKQAGWNVGRQTKKSRQKFGLDAQRKKVLQSRTFPVLLRVIEAPIQKDCSSI